LIEEVEAKIQKQQGDKWNRKFFENDLMGYAMRTKRYRFIVWKDYKNLDKDPIYFELYDHYTDPQETKNIADEQPDLVSKLMNHFNKGWKGNLAKM
jgi:iduronate 2-sulfatase